MYGIKYGICVFVKNLSKTFPFEAELSFESWRVWIKFCSFSHLKKKATSNLHHKLFVKKHHKSNLFIIFNVKIKEVYKLKHKDEVWRGEVEVKLPTIRHGPLTVYFNPNKLLQATCVLHKQVYYIIHTSPFLVIGRVGEITGLWDHFIPTHIKVCYSSRPLYNWKIAT